MVFLENGAVITGHSCSFKTDVTLATDNVAFETDILGGEEVIVLFFFIQFLFPLGSFLWFKDCSDWAPPSLTVQCLFLGLFSLS